MLGASRTGCAPPRMHAPPRMQVDMRMQVQRLIATARNSPVQLVNSHSDTSNLAAQRARLALVAARCIHSVRMCCQLARVWAPPHALRAANRREGLGACHHKPPASFAATCKRRCGADMQFASTVASRRVWSRATRTGLPSPCTHRALTVVIRPTAHFRKAVSGKSLQATLHLWQTGIKRSA